MFWDPTVDQLYADFDLSIDPPVDATNGTKLQLNGAIPKVLQQDIQPDWQSEPSPPPPPPHVAPGEVTLLPIKQTPPIPHSEALIDPFSPEYRAASIAEFASLVPSGNPDRDDLVARFTAAFDEAIAAHQSGSPPLFSTSFRRDDEELVFTHHLPHGDFEVMRVSAELLTDCQAWWAKFIYDLTLGLLGAVGLPVTPGNIMYKIYNMLIDEPSVNIVLNQMIVAMTSSTKQTVTLAVGVPPIRTIVLAFGVLAATYKAGLLWPIMKMGFSYGSWWAIFWAFRKVVELVFLPEAELADLIIGLTQWAVGLALHRQSYPTACPS